MNTDIKIIQSCFVGDVFMGSSAVTFAKAKEMAQELDDGRHHPDAYCEWRYGTSTGMKLEPVYSAGDDKVTGFKPMEVLK